MNRTWKQWGALLLVLVMALSLFPASALAARIDDKELPAIPAEEAEAATVAPAVLEEDAVAVPMAEGDDTSDDVAADYNGERNIATDKYTLTVAENDHIADGSTGAVNDAKDGNESTWWHSSSTTPSGGHWLAVELDEAAWVSAFRYKPRADTAGNSVSAAAGNGFVKEYKVETSADGSAWTEIATGTWELADASGNSTGAWQVVNFAPVLTSHIRLVGKRTIGNGNENNNFMHAAEIRVVKAATYTVSGTVQDANGPKEGAVVTVGGVTAAATGADGAFTLELPNGSHTPAVTLEGYELTGSVSPVVVNGAAVTGVTLTVERVVREVKGTVTAAGQPLSGAEARLVTGDAAGSWVDGVTPALTEADGGYTLNVNGVPAGDYKVRIAKAGHDAVLSEVFHLAAEGNETVTGKDARLTALDPSGADHYFDMTTSSPAYSAGANTAARVENGGLFMNFSGSSRAANQVKLDGVSAEDVTVEFDATRGGTGATAHFGVALRYADSENYIYVGQTGSGAWHSEGMGANNGSAAAVDGPSFRTGETRHFKVTLHKVEEATKVSLWVDGVQVLAESDEIDGHGPTAAGGVVFVCDGNNTSVTVQNLAITRLDGALIITMPETLAGYTVLGGAQDSPLKAGGGQGTFLAYAGDVINVYSAEPAARTMSAPLTVYKTEDNSVSSTENILHVLHNGSAHQERGNYVQFQMPAYDVTLTPTLEEVETKEITGVSILRTSAEPEVVNVDASATLRATITPAIGVEDLSVTWTSDNGSVVTVEGAPRAEPDANGADAAYATATITGHQVGEATITITTANGLSDTREVTVGQAVRNVIFSDTTQVYLYTNGATAGQGKTVTLIPTIVPAEATNPAVTWWSSDEKVATVDENGVVTAVAQGTAQIYVRSVQNPGAQAYRTVQVLTLPKALTLDVTQAELTVSVGNAGDTQVVVPTLQPDDATDKTIIWRTENSNVATVTKPWAADTGSQNALITAQGVGRTTITATSAADSSLVATVAVTVKQRIVGQATVSGETKFGSELTVDINAIAEAAKEHLTYAWYRGAAAEGPVLGTEKTYTPVQEDIGSVLTVKVTATGDYIGETTCTTGEITRADGYRMEATPTYVNCSGENARDGKITGLHADRLYEYQPASEDAETGVWTPVGANSTEITGLPVGTYRVRRAGDGTHLPGSNFETVTISWDGADDFDITIPTAMTGGDVTANIRQATAGAVVTLTVTPDEGYQLAENGLTVTEDANSGAVTVTPVAGDPNKYTFQMPGGPVSVQAAFEKKTYVIGHELTNINCDMAQHDHTARHGESFTITLTPERGHDMPSKLTVTVTETGEKFNDYTYTADPNAPDGRVLTFAHGVTQGVTVRGEATPKSFPVEYVRERVSFKAAPATAKWHQELIAAVTADAGYELPEEITVTMGSATLTAGQDYIYNRETGAVHIAADVVEDALTISVTGVKSVVPLEKVSVSGVAQVGQRLTANLTPVEADGSVTYQWYWVTLDGDGNVATEELIPGATGRSRVVTAASVGRSIVVKAAAVDGSGFEGTVTSQPTGAVIAADATEVLPTQVQIRRESVSIEVDGTDTLVAYVGPANATNKTVRWSTGDPAVVTVENGVITGIAPGTAIVTVTAEADGSVTDSCVVTVTAPKVVIATAEDVTVEYDGRAHGILVLVTNPVDGSAGVTYSTDGVNFHSSEPTFSAVGEHMVWYKVTARGMEEYQGQAKVTIEKATPLIQIAVEPRTMSKGGPVVLTVTLPDYVDRGGLSVEVNDRTLSVTSNEDGTYTVELPDARKTYTFTAALTETDHYKGVSATCTVRVGASSASRPATTTTTKTEEDGTKVTTVTKPDGIKTETTETPDGTKAVVETKPDGSKTRTVEQADGTKSEMAVTKDGDVTITVTDPDGEELVKTEIPAVIPEPEVKFDDVETAAPWAVESVNKVAGLELVKGTGGTKYSPVAPMTRGSLATVLHRLSQGKTDYEATFKDVAQGKYYTEGVAWAAKAKVVTGYSADIFAPDQIITREQLAVMLTRYAKLIGVDTKADANALNKFVDSEKTGAWATEGVAWCVENGILKGKSGNALDPTADVTRAEVAVMLDRFLDLVK